MNQTNFKMKNQPGVKECGLLDSFPTRIRGDTPIHSLGLNYSGVRAGGI